MTRRTSLYQWTVFVQIIAIISLCFYAYWKSGQQFVSIGALQTELFTFSDSGAFANFFEPEARPGVRTEIPDLKASFVRPGTRYVINSEGINGLREFAVEKPEGMFRIVTIGDSWTWGFIVNTEENFSSRLENLLMSDARCTGTNFEVINLGVPSYDLAYAAERYRTRGAKFDPSAIVWLIGDDDFSEPNEYLIEKMRRHEEEMKARGEVPNMVVKTNDIGGKLFVDDPDGEPLYAEDEINIRISARMRSIEDLKNEWSIRQIIWYAARQLAALNAGYEGPLVIMRNPYMAGDDRVHAAAEDLLKKYASQRKNTSILYFATDLANSDALFPEFHPNAKGHDIIARELLEHLVRTNVVPCRDS